MYVMQGPMGTATVGMDAAWQVLCHVGVVHATERRGSGGWGRFLCAVD